MKYLYQFLIIICFTFLGELLHHLLPLPIPAAVYGLVLLFLALQLKIVKLHQVKTAGDWLVGIMGILFVAPTVALLGSWKQISPHLIPIGLTVLLSTVVVFGVSGLVTQWLTRKEDEPHD